jgi:hypothetical protein
MISRDARTLAHSDAVPVLSTGICVPFTKAVSRGWIKYYWIGVILPFAPNIRTHCGDQVDFQQVCVP